MEVNWNFLGGRGAKQKFFCGGGGGSMDIFWNCTKYAPWSLTDRGVFLGRGGGEGALPFMAYTGTCSHIGYGERVDMGKVSGCAGSVPRTLLNMLKL